MNEASHWWFRYKNYSPGVYNLPNIGEVISDFRKKRYKTQDEFAIAAGVDKRTVQEWETVIMIVDMGRRILIARLLSIPPALLGLTWHQVYGNNHEARNPLEDMAEAVEEDAFYTYEDILILGWECVYKGGAPQIAYRVNRRLRKLQELVNRVPVADQEAWKALQCRFFHLAGSIAQHRPMYKGQALEHFTSAIVLANELEDGKELIAASHFHRADAYKQQGNFNAAKDDITASLTLADQTSAIMKGNIYLHAADIYSTFAGSSQTEQHRCKVWQDKVANILYKGNIEENDTFLKLNLAAVNHEKAKLLLSFNKPDANHTLSQKTGEAIRGKLLASLNTIPDDLTIWKMFFYLTEAKLYLFQHDIEGCAKIGKEALKVANVVTSSKGVTEVKRLYTSLNEITPKNPYVDNLGVALGLF